MKNSIIIVIFIAFSSDSFSQKQIQCTDDFRSKELSQTDLVQSIRTLGIECVIRMNGNGKDSDGLSVRQEEEICKKQGIEFFYLPMTKPYNEWAEEVIYYMFQYKSLIHCHHGYDRTGFIVAYLLMKYENYSFEEARKLNGWDKYDTYSKKFYPTLKRLVSP